MVSVAVTFCKGMVVFSNYRRKKLRTVKQTTKAIRISAALESWVHISPLFPFSKLNNKRVRKSRTESSAGVQASKATHEHSNMLFYVSTTLHNFLPQTWLRVHLAE